MIQLDAESVKSVSDGVSRNGYTGNSLRNVSEYMQWDGGKMAKYLAGCDGANGDTVATRACHVLDNDGAPTVDGDTIILVLNNVLAQGDLGCGDVKSVSVVAQGTSITRSYKSRSERSDVT